MREFHVFCPEEGKSKAGDDCVIRLATSWGTTREDLAALAEVL